MDADKRCLLCEAIRGTHTVFRRKRDVCDWCVDNLERTGHAWCVRGKHKVATAAMATGKANCKSCEAARNRGRCKREANTAWRAANPEKIRNYWKTETYRASQRNYKRKRRQTDADYRERVRQGQRRRYAANIEASRARIRRWRQERKLAAWRRIIGGDV